MHLAGKHYPTSFNFPYSTFGFIAATLETKSKDIENAKESILKEFQFVESGEIEYKEVEKSKREIIETKEGNFQMKYIPRGLRKIVEYEDSFTTSFKIAEYHLFGGDVYNFFNYTNQIAAVTLDDIREVANKFIRADKYGMVVLKPK
jgi:predicted Zn-dependent peptidase